MSDKDRGKAKVAKGKIKKQLIRPSTTHSQLASTSSPSPATPSPTLSSSSTPSSQTPHFTPPSSVPTQPSRFSPSPHCVVPPTQLCTESPGSSVPPTNIGLAPESSDTRDTPETQIGGDKPVLHINGDGFLPSHLAANGISDIYKSHYEEAWPSWKKVPSKTRLMWFEEFKRKYSIYPPDDKWARRNFEIRGAALLKNALNKVRKNMERPHWLGDYVWDRLCAHWECDSFKKKSAQAKANRASDCGGLGESLHTGGSITTSQHRANLTQLTGVAPSPSTLFRHTHQHKDKSWVDKRSAHIDAEFTRNMQEMTQRASEQGGPPPNELDVWCETAGVKKGRVYGLGLESTVVAGRSYYRGSSSSSDWVRREEFQELRNNLEQVQIERDELRARVENNERDIQMNNHLLREMMARINFQPSSLQSFPGYQPSHDFQSPGLHGHGSTIRRHETEAAEEDEDEEDD